MSFPKGSKGCPEVSLTSGFNCCKSNLISVVVWLVPSRSLVVCVEVCAGVPVSNFPNVTATPFASPGLPKNPRTDFNCLACSDFGFAASRAFFAAS